MTIEPAPKILFVSKWVVGIGVLCSGDFCFGDTLAFINLSSVGADLLATHNALYRQFRGFCLHLIDELRDFPHQTNALNSQEKTIPEISNYLIKRKITGMGISS